MPSSRRPVERGVGRVTGGTWRVVGARGVKVAACTAWGILREAGIGPAPRAGFSTWADHWGVCLMRRHRFIVDRWVWELPGGYVDEGEEPAAAAAREVEEETGWRPRGIEFVMSSQPVIGNADYPQDLYLAHGAELVGEPDVDETAEVRWVPVEETPAMIARGDILGAITIIGVQHALLRRGVARLPPS